MDHEGMEREGPYSPREEVVMDGPSCQRDSESFVDSLKYKKLNDN